MLVIEKNCVYEIDEECVKRRKVPMECGIADKIEEIERCGHRVEARKEELKHEPKRQEHEV